MSIFLRTKIDSKYQIMTPQLMTSFHNLDLCLERVQQEELKAENRLFISQKLKEI